MKLCFFMIFFLQFLLIFVSAPKVQALWLVDSSGQLIEMDSNGQVLGDENREQKPDGKDEEKKIDVKSLDVNKERVEIKSKNKRESEDKRIKIKLEQKDGQLKMKTKNEATGEETEIEAKLENKRKPELPEVENEVKDKIETEVLKIRELEEKNEVKINTKNDDFIIYRNNAGAITKFPLSVDSLTNTLTVTTPAGEKQVTILPDQAIQNMLSRNVIDRISGQNATDLSSRIKMTQKSDGSLVYEVEGEKQEKLFGLVPLKFKKTAIVSVETGGLLETKESFADKLLGLVSF